jgi:hypothetical protein
VECGETCGDALAEQDIAGFADEIGMSIAANGSVHSTSSSAPGAASRSALRVRKAGSGHLRPRRSSFRAVAASVIGADLSAPRGASSMRDDAAETG